MQQERLDPRARTRIARPALTARIAAALGGGSVLLVGDAGYGKTTALQAALADRRPCAWVQCTVQARDPGRLVLDLLAAVGGAVPGAVEPVRERLALPGPPVDAVGTVQRLASELDRLLVEPLIVVVDDAEHVADSPEAAAVIGELLSEHAAVRCAVASRRALPLRLAKLRASGAVVELGVADLAFTAEECAAYLQARRGRPPSDAEIETAMAATHGWPLGIALGVERDGGASGAVGSPAELSAFLDEEVLDRLEPVLRDGVLASSVPEAFDEAVLRALELDPVLLADAEAAGLQLRPVPDHPGWFAYQPLVRECLLDRLGREAGPAQLRALNAKVAPPLAAAGRPEQAIDHWLAAERFTEAVATLAARGPGLLRTAPQTGRAWLDALPAEVRAAPTCQLLDAQLAWLEGAQADAVDLGRRALAGLEDAGDAAGAWAARFALAEPLALSGRFEDVVTLADGFDTELPEAAVMPAVGVAFYATISLAALGRADAARALAGRLLAHPAGGPVAPMHLGWEVHWLLPAGDVAALDAAMEETVVAIGAGDPLGRMPQALLLNARILADLGRDDAALRAWAQIVALAHDGGIAYLADLGHSWRALLLARQGRTAEAEEELARCDAADTGGWHAYGGEVARALVAAHRSDASVALGAAERAMALVAPAPLIERHRAVMDLAPVLSDAGLTAEADALVDQGTRLVDAHFPDATGRYARALLLGLRAHLRWAEGDDDAAVDALVACLETAGDAASTLLRRLWRLLEAPLWAALERSALAPAPVLAAVAEADAEGAALVSLTEHPIALVRAAAIRLAARSGRPELSRRLDELSSDPDASVATAATAAGRRLRSDPPALRFELLGAFRVRRGAWTAGDRDWGRRVAQRVVRLLLVRAPEPVAEDELLEAFWGDKPADAARHGLQTAISSARRVLDVPRAASVLEAGERSYWLRLRPADAVDVQRFERAADEALAADGPRRRALLHRAEGAWGGEPLPEERFADWAVAWRERLIDRYVAVLVALADASLRDGDVAGATEAAGRLVERDPLNEAGHRLLMTAYARAGRRGHSLRQYLECRRALVEELGVEPAAVTADLQRRILVGEAV